MADLRTHAAGMQALLGHLREREGAIDHFYCDHRGLVTIAIGYLVDRGGAQGIQHGKQLAQQLSARSDVAFRKADGELATEAEVEADWLRVKAFGRANKGVPARKYGPVAKLRIDAGSIDAITSVVVRRFMDDLYTRKPFVIGHDVHVAMALIDARYNPAGIKLYGDNARVQAMWSALDPANGPIDAARAADLFTRVWKGRGGARYQKRHAERVKWLRTGLEAAIAAVDAVAAAPAAVSASAPT